MTIEESDFRLTSVNGNFWDLELLYTVRPKGKDARQEFKVDGYGLTLSSAIRRIANFKIEQKHPEETLTLKQYIKEFKQIINELNRLYL